MINDERHLSLCYRCAVRDGLQVKALLQEMANFEDAEPINQYQSMYDMVKRRSNKEREKEDLMKTMESRAKSLNQIAQVRFLPDDVTALCVCVLQSVTG